ncbi:hypothetical protein ES702_06734 [subsurface metagenome]
MDRQKVRQYLSEHPHYADFLIWLDRKFKNPKLNYTGLAMAVKNIMAEPLALLTEGGKKQ